MISDMKDCRGIVTRCIHDKTENSATRLTNYWRAAVSLDSQE